MLNLAAYLVRLPITYRLPEWPFSVLPLDEHKRKADFDIKIYCNFYHLQTSVVSSILLEMNVAFLGFVFYFFLFFCKLLFVQIYCSECCTRTYWQIIILLEKSFTEIYNKFILFLFI